MALSLHFRLYNSRLEKSIEEANSNFFFCFEKKKYKTISLRKLPKVSSRSQEVGARRRSPLDHQLTSLSPQLLHSIRQSRAQLK